MTAQIYLWLYLDQVGSVRIIDLEKYTELSCCRAFLCGVRGDNCLNRTRSIFLDSISMLALSAGAACFTLTARDGQRLVQFAQGALLTGWVAFFVGLVLISNSFNPAGFNLLGKQLAVLFLGALYGFGLFALTKLLSSNSTSSKE